MTDSNVRCSSCGGGEGLYLITAGSPGTDFPGRTLLYCGDCRARNHQLIDISLPIDLVTPDLFASLYELGRTGSDPETAIEIVFGKPDRELQARLEAILAVES